MLDGILTPMREVNGTISGATQLESGYQNQAQWGGGACLIPVILEHLLGVKFSQGFHKSLHHIV